MDLFALSIISNPADCLTPFTNRGKLWVGGLNAVTPSFISNNNIQVIVSLTPTALRDDVIHYRYKVRDHTSDQNRMAKLLPTITETIHKHRMNGDNVLVHCRAGVQRAPTVCTKYLERYGQQPMSKIIKQVRCHRPVAFCNGQTFSSLLSE